MNKADRIFLTWLPYSRRSQTLAANFKAEPVYFRYLAGKGNMPRAILRYFLMTWHTIGYLLWHRPKLVFVMNQPIFLPLTLYLLSRFTSVKYVIDSHSGLFIKPQWRWSLPLMKYAYRYSLFSIVTNQYHRDLVSSWGARVEVLGALSVDAEPVESFQRPPGSCLVVIGTYAADEPTIEILAACRRLPHIHFYITGSLKNAPEGLADQVPANVVLTDFQPRPRYVGLVQAMDGALILVKNDNVMQMGAYEAMSWAVPIITSNWPVLRENFYRGAIFVDNSPDEIVRAIHELYEKHEFYRQEITNLRQERQEAWERQISRINAFIQENV